MKGSTGKVFLDADGQSTHKANAVNRNIQSLEGRVELHFLPPYAPDLNPDEFVRIHMKTNGVSRRPLRRNESM